MTVINLTYPQEVGPECDQQGGTQLAATQDLNPGASDCIP